MNYFTEESIDNLTRNIDIADLIKDYVSLQFSGGSYKGLCPFHNERSPSFTVTPSKGLFYCFGCQTGGTAITFIQQIESLNYKEALIFLSEKYKLPLEVTSGDSLKKNTNDVLIENIKILYQKVNALFVNYLETELESEGARAYLFLRKIQSNVISDFKIGFAPINKSFLYNHLSKHHYTPDFLAKTGLFSNNYPKISFFNDRITFPIRNRQGEVIAFGGRSLEEYPKAKYLNSPETLLFSKKKNLFGFYENQKKIRTQKIIILCEGYLDVLAFYNAGLPAVAPLGTSFTEEQAQYIKGYVELVYLCFDSDEAGQKAFFKAATLLEDMGLRSKRIILPSPYKDPADVYENYIDSEATNILIDVYNNAKDSYDYILEVLSPFDPLDTMFNSKIQKVFSFIEIQKSLIVRDAYIQKLSNYTGLSRKSLEAEYKQQKPSFTPKFSNKSLSLNKENNSIAVDFSIKGESREVWEFISYLTTFDTMQSLDDSYHEKYDFYKNKAIVLQNPILMELFFSLDKYSMQNKGLWPIILEHATPNLKKELLQIISQSMFNEKSRDLASKEFDKNKKIELLKIQLKEIKQELFIMDHENPSYKEKLSLRDQLLREIDLLRQSF